MTGRGAMTRLRRHGRMEHPRKALSRQEVKTYSEFVFLAYSPDF
jgi:hypothetical protein